MQPLSDRTAGFTEPAEAFACKDNRAFCKYLCPITVFLKLMRYFSLLRVQRHGEFQQYLK